jgi:hypothetical protein
MEMVDFKKSAVPSDIAGQIEDRETADHADAPIKTREEKQIGAMPDIRAAADARGKMRGRAEPVPVAEKRNFLQRFFGAKPSAPNPPPPKPVGPPRR